ncbi:MAG TPA: 2'-5' RNA ligase family protein [Mycobacteriales bacterium]|nr:2'-5' RNA ligase family protein [Mycobacteriales bacterium]
MSPDEAAHPGDGPSHLTPVAGGPAGTVLMIGVAIGIPEPFASELRSWRRRAGDPQAELVPPHVTLLPPTEVAVGRIAAVEEHLGAVAGGHGPFEMRLSGTGTFRPVSEVVFVVVSAGIAACELLERDVRSGPLDRRVAFPYHPHVTVAHGVPAVRLEAAYEGLGGYRAGFFVSVFTMFEQGTDGVWQRRRDFTLTGAAGRSVGACR